jgi:hypothetical protein
VFGVGLTGDTHFYIMQCIDGCDQDWLLEDVSLRQPATQLLRPARDAYSPVFPEEPRKSPRRVDTEGRSAVLTS